MTTPLEDLLGEPEGNPSTIAPPEELERYAAEGDSDSDSEAEPDTDGEAEQSPADPDPPPPPPPAPKAPAGRPGRPR